MLAWDEAGAERFEAPIRLGVVSDTHLRSPVRLPEQLLQALAGVDLILHAGDLTTLRTLRLFESIAPVRAVRGNNDEPDLQRMLPLARLLIVGPFRLGLIHGHGFGVTARAAAESAFLGRVDIGVFGHSHRPHHEWRDRTLLFNPGSATNRRWEPRHSFGIIQITDRVDAELRFLP